MLSSGLGIRQAKEARIVADLCIGDDEDMAS
jgi:hypothetical protein